MLGRALANHVTAITASAGADVDQTVRGHHRRRIVFDNDDSVACYLQITNAVQQLMVVSGMEPNRRFIQDIANADQAAADTARKPNSLKLAAAERGRWSIKRQILYADLAQKTKTLQNVSRDRRRNQRLELAQAFAQRVKPLMGSVDRHGNQLINRQSVDLDRECFGAKTSATATAARLSIVFFTHNAQAFAIRAGAVGTIEAKRPRLNFLEARAAIAACHCRIVDRFVWRRFSWQQCRHQSFAQPQRQRDGLCETRFDAFAYHQAIHDRFDRMVLPRRQRWDFFDQVHFAIDTRANQTCSLDGFDYVTMGTATSANHRRHQHRLGSVGQGCEVFTNRIGGLLGNRASTFHTVGRADSGVQQSQIVIDF